MLFDHKWSAADTITSLRIVLTLFLSFLPLRSSAFLTIYILAGLTDILDGWLARKSGTASAFGAKLDSIADLLFYGTLLLRIVPVLWKILPMGMWYVVAAVIVVRLAAYAIAAFKYHRFASLHTPLNKLTGASVFLLPFAISASEGITYCWVVCVLALAAALEELTIHLQRNTWDPDGLQKPARSER